MVGAGFIVRDVQLVAYRNAGFNVCGLVSRTPEIAREVGELRGVPRVFDTLDAMLENPAIEIVDIAVSPDQQLPVIRQIAGATRKPKGILAQKPLAMDYCQALDLVKICRDAGIRLAVNQNIPTARRVGYTQVKRSLVPGRLWSLVRFLMDAIACNREPEHSGDDNVKTMVLIEACYPSIAEKRLVRLSEIFSAR